MHVGIFAERFVGRYGADRVGIILAELLEARGHRVTLVGARFSQAVLDRFEDQVLRVPSFPPHKAEKLVLDYLKKTHYFRQRHQVDFDVCLVGSYPFITSIPYLQEISRTVTFIDYGVVPTTGYPPHLIEMIESVRNHRQANLPFASNVLAISDFIARDQSIPESQDRCPVRTILLGADHLSTGLGHTEKRPGAHVLKLPDPSTFGIPDKLQALKEKGKRLILLLGRWEPWTYKNSQASFDVMRHLKDLAPEAVLLVLADPSVAIPTPEIANNFLALGHPTDAELLQVLEEVDAGISVSLWEGFNLPIAELQFLGKPALALNLAAHPEVILDQEHLCSGAEDMALKLFRLLCEDRNASEKLESWREQFSWERFRKDFFSLVEHAA